MLTTREIADRLEIDQVIQRYFRAMDTWDYALLDQVFAPDAVVHYAALEGLRTTYAEMVPRFREFNQHFSFMQHLGGQLLIELAGETAQARTSLRALHVQTALDGRESRWVIYGAYRDRLARTPAGWRIRERFFQQLRTEGTLLPFEEVRRYAEPPWLEGR